MLGNRFKQRERVSLFGQKEIAKQPLIKFCRTCSDRLSGLRLGQKEAIAKQPLIKFCRTCSDRLSVLRLGQKKENQLVLK